MRCKSRAITNRGIRQAALKLRIGATAIISTNTMPASKPETARKVEALLLYQRGARSQPIQHKRRRQKNARDSCTTCRGAYSTNDINTGSVSNRGAQRAGFFALLSSRAR